MTARGTGLLLALLVTLAGYLWVAEVRPRRAAPPLPAGTPEAPPLLATSDVARVELQEGGTRLTAVRRDGGWADGSGRPWRPAAVADLVETLGGLRPIMVVDPDPEQPADYGLGPDETQLRLFGPDGQALLALEVGERNPAWTALYARLAGRREVILVGAVLRWELEKLRDASPAQ
jgi:hypothetical protein